MRDVTGRTIVWSSPDRGERIAGGGVDETEAVVVTESMMVVTAEAGVHCSSVQCSVNGWLTVF